jgi:hypothetical protein
MRGGGGFMLSTKERRAAIVEHSLPLWLEEFEIGFRAFRAANIYSETHWLAVQIWKEWNGSGVYGPAGTDLGTLALVDEAAQPEEELAHYEALKNLGKRMATPPGEYQPGGAALALLEFRNGLWGDRLKRLAVGMSEGGGLGLFHGAIAALPTVSAPRPQDALLRSCLAGIIEDEKGHLGSAIDAFVAERLDPDLEAMALARLTDCLRLKIAERQEQFAAQLCLEGADVGDPQLYRQIQSDYSDRVRNLFG